ncbi:MULTISPECIES: DUF488 family protein [Cryobacterium]|uniref:DUF488 family protein n=1 Tax=Cryobacterium breve TaxID=1259258 RepID=A0ABY2IXY4_9MICO|nr:MULTISPECIES: DUF488 family protein [Cryobacterium]TFC96819.1 DUF488 family protein [Cryobacterium sp. TmT3-12]TFC97385.1 DUF488 family protein [Cryobacterium breve]
MNLRIKRIYDDAADGDGCRILVDRLWPRGVTKERANLDVWLKEIAPSPALRTWWKHDPKRQAEFAIRYRAELDGNPVTMQAVTELRELAALGGTSTLLYGAKDPKVNHAQILADYLGATLGSRPVHT